MLLPAWSQAPVTAGILLPLVARERWGLKQSHAAGCDRDIWRVLMKRACGCAKTRLHDTWIRIQMMKKGQSWNSSGSSSSSPIHSPSLPRVKVGGGGERRGDLVWIEKNRWETNSFTPEDCFPVGDDDVWSRKPEKLSFAKQSGGKVRRGVLRKW